MREIKKKKRQGTGIKSEAGKSNKHLTLNDRMEIQECLGKRMTFKAIAELVGKDATTVSKEVRLHSKAHTNRNTRSTETCPRLMKAPFVCNGCERRYRSNCNYARRAYSAAVAHTEYRNTLREAREGIPLNKAEFYETDRIISAAVRSGQHIYHAIQANQLPVSKSTVYRHIAKGYYGIRKLDLPHAVKFKPRKKSVPDYVPQGIRANRSFADFKRFTEENSDVQIVEMDPVIGSPDGKVIMTFHFVSCDFMFGILLDNKTAAEAAQRVILFKRQLLSLGLSFSDVFPLLLTDNGGEFSNVFAFECAIDGTQETHVFYCDPNASYQKPHIENNHSLFRSIVPS